MRALLRIVFFQKGVVRSLIFVVLLMALFIVASQMEIIALGVITRKGPGFFELFAAPHKGSFAKSDQVSWDDVQQRWSELDRSGRGVVTVQQASEFLRDRQRGDLIGRVLHTLSRWFPIEHNPLVLASFIVLVACFKAITLFGYRFTAKKVAIRVSRDLRERYFVHLQKLPMEFYHAHTSGGLAARVMADAALIADGLNSVLVNYLQTPLLLVSTFVLCFLTSWQLTLVIFLGFPLIFYPILFLARRVRRTARKIQKNQEYFASVLLDFLAGVQTVKLFGMEQLAHEKYQMCNEEMALLQGKNAKYDLVSRPIIHTIGMLFLATTLLCGLYALQMDLSDVLVYCGFLYFFYEPIKKFSDENAAIQRGVIAVERMEEILQCPPDSVDSDQALICSDVLETVAFEGVWFRYSGGAWVLKDVSFCASKGELVAIVGPTGSGKSTLLQLLPRLFEAERGSVTIDGVSVKEYKQSSLREAIAFVPQRPFLFLGTVAENIACGRGYSLAQIQEAARRARADEFIQTLPQGYDTPLAEGGKNLSGGQQQRLAIARAFVRKSALLILDEATASLDLINEQKIKDALEEGRDERITLVIAHRLSTIEHADRIIYLEEGEKRGEGTLTELLARCAPFREMWNVMQKKVEHDAQESRGDV